MKALLVVIVFNFPKFNIIHIFLCFYFIDVEEIRINVQTDGDALMDEENHFFCKDIGAVVRTGLKVVNQYVLPEVFHNRISLIDNEIWVPCSYKAIDVFSLNGKQHKVEIDDKAIIVVKKAFNGDVIAGGRTDLWVMNKLGTEWEKIY